MSSYFFVTLQILLIEHSKKDNSHIKRVKFKYSIFSNINKIGIKIANILLIMPQAIDLNLKENLRRFLMYFKINLFSHLVKSNIIFLLFSIESNAKLEQRRIKSPNTQAMNKVLRKIKLSKPHCFRRLTPSFC